MKIKENGKAKALFFSDKVYSNSLKAFELYKSKSFGEKKEDKIIYSFVEALYLLEKKELDIFYKNKRLSFDEFLKVVSKKDANFLIKYQVFSDLRKKGYIVKSALKFGADFRVYDKFVKPGKGHSKWIAFCVKESSKINWQDFSAKNRLAHSTKKNLLIALVDEEGDVSYYEVKWIKP